MTVKTTLIPHFNSVLKLKKLITPRDIRKKLEVIKPILTITNPILGAPTRAPSIITFSPKNITPKTIKVMFKTILFIKIKRLVSLKNY